MRKSKTKPDRPQLLSALWTLASARTNDAVYLALLEHPDPDLVHNLELDALSELKRSANGGVELKFTDRAKILETLYHLLELDGEPPVENFLRCLDGEDSG